MGTQLTKLTAEAVRNLLSYDPETGVFLWKWRKVVRWGWNERFAGKVAGSKRGRYLTIAIADHTYYAHRLAWLIVTGAWPPHEIDHRDLDGYNNRWENLRSATHQQNRRNQGKRPNTKYGLKGVRKSRDGDKYVATIHVSGRPIHLGNYETPQAAHAAYCAAARQHFGEFARSA